MERIKKCLETGCRLWRVFDSDFDVPQSHYDISQNYEAELVREIEMNFNYLLERDEIAGVQYDEYGGVRNRQELLNRYIAESVETLLDAGRIGCGAYSIFLSVRKPRRHLHSKQRIVSFQ